MQKYLQFSFKKTKQLCLQGALLIGLCAFSFTAQSQDCVLSCLAIGYSNINFTVTSSTGNPCVVVLSVNHDNPTGTLNGPVACPTCWDFGNLTCNSCPNIPASTTVTWTLTSTNGDCNTGGPYTIGWGSGASGLCGGAQTCVLPTSGPLPVELINFQVQAKENQVQLNWQTASEINNEGFEVQHSFYGLEWETLEFVEGNGTTFEQQSYSYTHDAPTRGTNYYRLKQVDFDGVFEYSKSITVEVGNDGRGFTLSPNPSLEGSNQIRLQHRTEKAGVLTIYNQIGQQVYQMAIAKDDYTLTIDVPKLAAGTYVAALQSGKERFVERLIVK